MPQTQHRFRLDICRRETSRTGNATVAASMTQLQALLTMNDMEATASRLCVVPAAPLLGGLYMMIRFMTSTATTLGFEVNQCHDLRKFQSVAFPPKHAYKELTNPCYNAKGGSKAL